MSLQISHGKYTLFLAEHFVRFRAWPHIVPEEKQPAIDYVLTEEHDDDGFYIIKGYEV
jgi:hypothetical protein